MKFFIEEILWSIFFFLQNEGGRGQLKKKWSTRMAWHWLSIWCSRSFSCSWFHSKQSIFLIASWVESLDLAANFVGTVKLFIRFNAFRSFSFFWLQTRLDPQTNLGANMLLDSLVICQRTISRCQICYKIFLLFPPISLYNNLCTLWLNAITTLVCAISGCKQSYNVSTFCKALCFSSSVLEYKEYRQQRRCKHFCYVMPPSSTIHFNKWISYKCSSQSYMMW